MTLVDASRGELLEATDAEIEEKVAHADLLVLRGLLYQLTGAEDVAATRAGYVQGGFGQVPVVIDEADRALLRRRAVEFLVDYRDRGAPPIEIGPEERLVRSMTLARVRDLTEAELRMLREELALDPWARSLQWRRTPDPDKLANFAVTIIGAGMGGLNAALMLRRAGISYQVFEKNEGVGGTWHENRYPGARVDTPSRGYTHVFGARFPYPYAFCPAIENQRYFDWVADEFGLREEIAFGTEVREMTWDEAAGMWEIRVAGPDGERTVRSNAVITAVGFLNRPRIAEIEGALEFEGPSWHTSRWPADQDLAGKRVAVIGTGSTGYQMTPELALEAEHLVLFQRTPSWMFDVPGYRSPLPEAVGWLDRNFPFYTNFLRMRQSNTLLNWNEVTDIDPDFEDEHALNPINKAMRDGALAFLRRKLGEDEELIAKMTPAHPPFSQRPVIVDSEYSVVDAIQRDDVTLVTDGIARINKHGIEASDGTQHDVDVIVYATGFHATEYLFPMRIAGRDGRSVEEFWAESLPEAAPGDFPGGARAYRWCMYPGFPNLFSLYGPNTNGGLGPATFHELTTRFILQVLEQLILEDKTSVEPTADAYWQHNELIDERNAVKVWSDPRARTYYWTDHGRSAVQCPLEAQEIYSLLRHPDWDDLDFR